MSEQEWELLRESIRRQTGTSVPVFAISKEEHERMVKALEVK